MLMKKPSKKDIRTWQNIYEKYKDTLVPNKKTGPEIVEFLKANYSVTEIASDDYGKIVADNILLNEFSKNKLKGATPYIRLFKVDDAKLMNSQDKVFADMDIIVGIEMNTSYLFVQGSSTLYDELFVFTGLDEYDLKNYFLVAQYVQLKNYSF